jgi:hypothetical protein
MQKIFYVNTSQNYALINAYLKEINDFMGKMGKILSVTPSKVPGRDNTVDWLIVADNGNSSEEDGDLKV